MSTLMATEPTFAARLRELRELRGLTLAKLAEKAGLHLQAVAKLEQGLRPNPTWDTVKSLADALGVSCEEFRRPASEVPPEGDAEVDVPPHADRPRGKRK
jgi:transcriptional regulator with XRE-family HTH domain